MTVSQLWFAVQCVRGNDGDNELMELADNSLQSRKERKRMNPKRQSTVADPAAG